MNLNFDKINWHDMELKRVEEDVFEHKLFWHVSYDSSENCDGSRYEEMLIIFSGAECHSVKEGVVFGNPTILDGKCKKVKVMYYDKYKMTFSTTAGKRVIYANSVEITPAIGPDYPVL